jgi:hypothetical protein
MQDATLAFNVSIPASSTFSFNSCDSTHAVQFASTTTSHSSVNGIAATFSGQGNVNGQTGYNFTVTVKDGDGAGSGLDTVSVAITGHNNFSYSTAGTIAGGDIRRASVKEDTRHEDRILHSPLGDYSAVQPT